MKKVQRALRSVCASENCTDSKRWNLCDAGAKGALLDLCEVELHGFEKPNLCDAWKSMKRGERR